MGKQKIKSKKTNLAKWLLSPSMNPRTTLVLTVAWIGLLSTIHFILPMRAIEARIISPVLFHVREALDRAPPLAENIKVFTLDDVTVNHLRSTDLTLKQWAEVLSAIDSKKPKAIIIDALFGTLDAQGPDAAAALARLGSLATPVYSGSFPSPGPIYGRSPLTLNGPAYQSRTYGEEPLSSIANFRSSLIFGPSPELSPVFSRVGHILYGEDFGSFFPFLGLKDEKVLPHLMLLPFDQLAFDEQDVTVGEARFSLAKDGSVPINFGLRSSHDERVRTIVHLLNANWQNQALDQIGPGDYVYLVPLFFTGNTDFKPSPIGLIPGSYSHLAVLNSILQNSTVRNVESESLLIFAFAVLITLCAWWMTPFALIVTLVSLSLAWVLLCLGLFAYQGLILPYLLPELALVGIGITLLMQKIEIADRKARMIRQTLEGFVPPDSLELLQRHPENLSLSLDARERLLTIVFIDIVGFSLMVEKQMPRVAFEGLQAVIKDITEIVHRHGGIVNKTLGDGLLCFFGYSLEDNKELSNHAEEALDAAMEIQRNNVNSMLSASQPISPVFPLRIGINTGAVFMGNLGAGERLDITVVGHGVNFAKRLESACQAHLILIGPTTQGFLSDASAFGTGVKRWIAIKHHEKPVESWEYDPFYRDTSLRERAAVVYEESSSLSKREDPSCFRKQF